MTLSQKVSTFLNVGGAPYRYTFLLVLFNDYENRVKDELDRQAEPFGADLDTSGMFVRPFPQRKYDIAEEVRLKPWPTEIAQRLDSSDLALLIIDRDFGSFDPREHAHAVIVLDDYLADVDSIEPLLQTLASKTRRGEDVLAYLQDVAKREKQREQAEGGAAAPARLASYIEIKPQIFGVGIDLKAILRDIADRLSSRSQPGAPAAP